MAEKTLVCRADEVATGAPRIVKIRGLAVGIVRCAWHGWEFDIVTGKSLVDPKVSARIFPVTVDAGNVYVHA